VMQVIPLRQPAVDVIIIGVNHAPRMDRGSDDRVDGRLLDVLQHADDDLPSPLNHPQDRWLLLLQGPSAPLAFEASPPTESLFLLNRFGMSLMSGDDVDLVAFDLAGENDLGLVLDDALPQLRAHPLGVVGIEIQLAGDLLVGEIQPEENTGTEPRPARVDDGQRRWSRSGRRTGANSRGRDSVAEPVEFRHDLAEESGRNGNGSSRPLEATASRG